MFSMYEALERRVLLSAAVGHAAESLTTAPVIAGCTLVNADTNKDIMPLSDGTVLDPTKLPRDLNVRANTTGPAQSVQFTFDGKSRLEQQAPWSVFGDTDGHYLPGTFAIGSHTISARAFAGKNATGASGPLSTIHLVVTSTGAITGVVYNDHNVNGVQDKGDAGISKVKVFIDLNANGVLNVGEPSTLSNSIGAYTFTNVKPGTYHVSQVVPAGYRQGYPFGNSENSATVAPGSIAKGVNFGDTTTSRVSGSVFVNLNSHGTGPGKTGIPGVTVVVRPVTRSGPSYTVVTNDVGYYVAGALPNQAYFVTLTPPGGYQLVTGSLMQRTPVLGSGQTADNVNFLGSLAVPVTFVSQQRSLAVKQGIDTDYYSRGIPAGGGAAASGFGHFNQAVECSFDTGRVINNPQDPNVHQIRLNAKASQDSTLLPSEISASGAVSATEDDGNGSAGATYAFAKSVFKVTFRVYAPEKYSLAANLAIDPEIVAGNPTYGGEGTLTLVGPGGKQLIPSLDETFDHKQSGTLAAGTYTLTFTVTARDQDDWFPVATCGVDVKFG